MGAAGDAWTHFMALRCSPVLAEAGGGGGSTAAGGARGECFLAVLGAAS